MKENWLDANVILRFLLNDHQSHSKRALELIETAGAQEMLLKVPSFILCEVIYVLEGLEFSRESISRKLIDFSRLPAIKYVPEEILIEALLEYPEKNCDFPDILLMSLARNKKETAWSFNKNDFRHLGGPWQQP